MYETFDHTADVGLRIRADSRESLFADAGRALFSLLVENPDDVRCVHEEAIRVDGAEDAFLLLDWLNELLYLFGTRGLLLREFDVAFDARGLAATARGEPCDPARHRLEHEVKAITYHGLHVRSDGGRWTAEVIVDI